MLVNLTKGEDMWKQAQSNERPKQVEVGKSTVYIRKNITQIEGGFEYLEQKLPLEDWELYKALASDERSDIDFALALLGADELIPELTANWDSRIEKYKQYYQSGQWSLDRINMLRDRGLITDDEYNYIVGEN